MPHHYFSPKMVYFLLAWLVSRIALGGEVDYACIQRQSWQLMNEYGSVNSLFSSASTDVTNAKINDDFTAFQIKTDTIPKYDTLITPSIMATLNSRPKKTTDFVSSATSTKIESTVTFGQNIGYTTASCSLGYWPPGPSCPTKQSATASFTLTPAKESSATGCYTSVGTIGRFVNGAAIFNAADTASYNSAGVWHSTAMSHEVYDLDICLGHAAQGIYHHHSWSPCLSNRLGDDGSGHSPIYGWVSDGFPIHGPYQAFNTLAKSCWKTRTYSSTAAGSWGCADGKRSCVLKNFLDPGEGTTAVSAGPDVTDTVTTLSKNTILAASGIYVEDYYYDSICGAQGGASLNHNNGHDHGDGLGFHYHTTVDQDKLPVYPFTVGLQYYGCLPSGTACASNYYSTMGPGGATGGGGGAPKPKPPPKTSQSIRMTQEGPPPMGGDSSGSSSTSTSTCAASSAVKQTKTSKCASNGRTFLSFTASQKLGGISASALSGSTAAKNAFKGAVMALLGKIHPQSVEIVSVATSTRRLSEVLLVASNCDVTYKVVTLLEASGYSQSSSLKTAMETDLSNTASLASLSTLLAGSNATVFSSLSYIGAASVSAGTVLSSYTEAPTPSPVEAPKTSLTSAAIAGIVIGVLGAVAGAALCFYRTKLFSYCTISSGDNLSSSQAISPIGFAHAGHGLSNSVYETSIQFDGRSAPPPDQKPPRGSRHRTGQEHFGDAEIEFTGVN